MGMLTEIRIRSAKGSRNRTSMKETSGEIMPPRRPRRDQRHREADKEGVPDDVVEERDGVERRRPPPDRRERDHNELHREVHRYSVSEPARYRVAEEE